MASATSMAKAYRKWRHGMAIRHQLGGSATNESENGGGVSAAEKRVKNINEKAKT
jgi:hypothetical protein